MSCSCTYLSLVCTCEYRVSFTTNQQNNKCSQTALPSYIHDPGVSFQLIRRFPWQPPEIQRLAQNCYCCRCQKVVQEVEGRRMYMTHTHTVNGLPSLVTFKRCSECVGDCGYTCIQSRGPLLSLLFFSPFPCASLSLASCCSPLSTLTRPDLGEITLATKHETIKQH